MSDERAVSVASGLRFPFAEPPRIGEVVEVRPGLLWLRLPLPYQLDHVNVYLIEDGDGWVIVDAGISTAQARAAWEAYFDGPLRGMKIAKILVTHFHPDHIGLAGWLCARFQAPLLTSLSSYMSCRVISLDPRAFESASNRNFYKSHGMDEAAARIVSTQGHEYLRQVEPLPETYRRLLMGDALTLGGATYRVVTGDGHVAEQVMLYCDSAKLLIAADQVLERISPNVAVWAGEPDGDPLGHYLRSLRLLLNELPADVLVLPGHMRPFYGLRQRSQELIAHHEMRCGLVLEACRDADRSVADLVPLLFRRALDPHQMGFAFAETLAHANRLVRRGELETVAEGERILFRVADRSSV
ncbi:MAG TPA: MBL fold metallo-hydrolase [Roseiarcus sp.]|nr:MBL fold metallo-hydrolase [Roseiarcus sp.]